jgi:hypothetical protein
VQELERLTQHAYQQIGIEPPKLGSDANSNATDIVAHLREADVLDQIASSFDWSVREMVAWRDNFDSALPARVNFERLATLRLLADAKQHAQLKFTEETLRFLRQIDSASNALEWLEDLDASELACIVRQLEGVPWVVPAAVLVRRGFDQEAKVFAPHFNDLLLRTDTPSRRRGLMRFCDRFRGIG